MFKSAWDGSGHGHQGRRAFPVVFDPGGSIVGVDDTMATQTNFKEVPHG